VPQGWHAFAAIRRVVIFLLGVFIILDALRDKSDSLAELIVGTIMVGVLPIENLLQWVRRPIVIDSRSKQSFDYEQGTHIPSETKQEAPSAPDKEAPLSD